MHAGRNIAILGAHRQDYRISFFDAALLTDPENVLAKQGPNTKHPDMISFSDFASIAKLEPVLRAYLAEAIDADPDLAEAFRALTPGRQKSYLIHLNGTKKSETRLARIGKARPKIIAGKGAMER